MSSVTRYVPLMSKPLRVILAVFGLLITLYATMIAIMSTEWFHHYLLRQAEARLESLTGARVEIGAMIVRPTVLLVTLEGLVLHGRESVSEPPLLSARTVVARINPLGLLRSRVLLQSLDCDRAEAHLRTYPDGSTNLPGPQRPPSTGHPVVDDLIDLALRRATLTHANLYWNNQRIPLDFSARNVAFLMRFNPAGTQLLSRHALKGVSSVLSSGDRYMVSISSSELTYGLPGWTVPPLAFAAQLDFSRNDLALRSLTWRSSGLRGQASLSLYRLPSLNAQLALKTEGELAGLAKTLGFPGLKSGSFDWDAQATYQDARQEVFEVKGRLQARRLKVADPSFALGDIDLSTDYFADRRHVELSNLKLSLLGGTVQGRGEGSLQGPSPKFTVRTELHQLSLAQLLDSTGVHDVTQKLHLNASVGGTADITWSGKLEDLSSSFDLSFEPLGGQPGSRSVVGFARGTAKAAPGLSLNLEDAELQTPHGLLRAGGTVGGGAINLNVLLTTSDFEEWRPLADVWSRPEQPVPLVLKSPATFSGTVLGSMDQPQVRGRIAVGAFDLRGWGWDRLEANVFVSPQLLQVNSGRLVHKDSALTFNIGLGLDRGLFTPSSVVHIIAEAQRTPLAGLRDALELHYPIEGSATGHLDLSGTRANLTGTGAIHVEQGQIDGESFDSLSAKFRVEESVWDIQGIRLVKGDAQIKGQARLDPSQQLFSAELRASDLSLADIRPLLFHGVTAPATPGTLQGHLQFDFHGEGTVQNPQLQSTFEVRDLISGGSPIGHLRGQLSWQGTRLQVKGDFAGPDGVLNFDGSAQTEKDWPIQLSGSYTNFRVDPWVNWAEPDALKVAVTSSGSLRLSGPLKDPGRLELQTEAESLEIGLPVSGPNGMVWKNQQPVRLTYAGGMLAVSRFGLHGPSTELEIEGSLRLTGQPVLALNVQGHADAAIIRLIDPTMLSAGSFELDLKAAGSPSKPLLSGAITVKDLSIGYPDLPVRASGLNGEVRLEGDRAVVSLRERSGQSPLGLSGYFTLIGPTRFDLRLDLDHERLEFPAEVTSILGGHLRFVGTPENPQLVGQLVVEQTAVRPDFDVLAWMDRLQRPGAVPASGAGAPFASKILVNVAVVSHPQVRIESRNLRLVAVIDLRLQGTAANPVALGTIRLLSGDTVIRGNRYQVTRGDITLSNPVRTTPVLDLSAQTRVQRYALTLNINGPLDRAKISYRSDPPLRSEEVLSLLALGYAPSEQQMTAGGSGGPNLTAGSLLSAALSSGVTGRVQRLFGVTNLRVDPSQYQTTTAAGYQVTVEQQLAPDFTITYILNTGVAGHNVVRLEWAIRENASVIAERDINGVYGVELRFRRRFK